VEADACISGRHMLPLRRLQTEPRFVVEVKVSYPVHVSSCPYRNQFNCHLPLSFVSEEKSTSADCLLLRSTAPDLDSRRSGLHSMSSAAKPAFTSVKRAHIKFRLQHFICLGRLHADRLQCPVRAVCLMGLVFENKL
jgi:hypothetical protein